MTSVLPSETSLAELQRVLEAEAFESIRQAYGATSTADGLVAMRPIIRLLRLDDHHLIVRIEFAGPEQSTSNVAAISQWGVLQSLDRRLCLDELQGLPCVYWSFIRAAREVEP